MAGRAPVFAARGLCREYATGAGIVRALRGVSLTVAEGEFLVLLGPSGSGKSTLLNILGGLDRPTAGSLHFRDTDLTAADETALTGYRRDHVGFVFQFYNLMPSLTARENVALVTEIAGNPMAPEDALARVGLADRMDHFPSELSGGEQQRVAIARSIAKRPDVLLCDEPTGALDVETGAVVLDVMQRLNEETGTATVIITHNAVIGGMADRVITMRDGMIAAEVTHGVRRRASELQW